jgi:hypothetical protein
VLHKRELATVLAALRFWQHYGSPRINSFFDRLEIGEQELFQEIATDSRSFAPLTSPEIDVLCERLKDGGTLEHEPCECEQPGHFRSGIPGILAHLEDGRLVPGASVERCDLCQRYPNDETALQKLVELGMT